MANVNVIKQTQQLHSNIYLKFSDMWTLLYVTLHYIYYCDCDCCSAKGYMWYTYS